MAFYTPRRLIEVKNEIKKKHPLKKTLKAASAENIDLKVLIMFLESLEPDMVEEQAYTLTDEEICVMILSCNDLQFDVCINRADLFGEPAVGRRFKGTIWMQGYINFP